MQGICGYVRLDDGPAPAHLLTDLTASLCPNPSHVPRIESVRDTMAQFASARWGPGDSAPADRIAIDTTTGCLVVADARLDQRRELARACHTPAREDIPAAELILRAWLHAGTGCADRLRGDFAFVLWDPRERMLYCARDIMGARPLYIHHQPGRLFAFASRAEALARLAEVGNEINTGRIADTLVPFLEGVDKTSTFYQKVQRLPPAHWLRITPNAQDEACYWQPEPGRVVVPQDSDGWATAFTDVLETAIARHLDDGERVGCMLSGGLDSSALAVVAADQLAHAGAAPLPTFSSVSNTPDCPETAAIKAMLSLPGFDPLLIDPAKIEAWHAPLAQALQHADEPFDISMGLLHAQYHAAADCGIGALIDGIDGDILLAERSTLVRQLRHGNLPGAWRNIRGLQRVFPGFSALRYLLSLSRAAYIPHPLRRALRPAPLIGQTAAAITNSFIHVDFARDIHLGERLQRFNAWSASADDRDTMVQNAKALQHTYTTCGLERYHRVAAWHGVQPRHPLLDRELLELCVNLPDTQRIQHGWTKAVLRNAMRHRLPKAVCWRQGKESLGAEVSHHLLPTSRAAFVAELARYRDLLRPYVDLERLDRYHHSLDKHGKARVDLGSMLPVLSLGRWLQQRRRASHRGSEAAVASAPAAL